MRKSPVMLYYQMRSQSAKALLKKNEKINKTHVVYLFQVPYESDVASTEISRMDSIGRERDSYRID